MTAPNRTSHNYLVFAPTFPPAIRGGGPARSIEAMVNDLDDGEYAYVLAPARDHGEKDLLRVNVDQWISRTRHSVFYYSSPASWLQALRSISSVKIDLIYLNSIFHSRQSIAPSFMHKFGMLHNEARLSFAPRGELFPEALAKSRVKKKLFLRVFRTFRFHMRSVFHSTSHAETNHIRSAFGPNAKIIERSNASTVSGALSFPSESPRLRLVYASRIVPHKGLLVALQALSSIAEDVKFEIYGPEEDAQYTSLCKIAAADTPTNVEIHFNGSFTPDEIQSVFARSDLMVLPTKSENFGHIILESFASGCPVLTTRNTPWTSTLEAGAGYIASLDDISSWAKALTAFTELSPEAKRSTRVAAYSAYETHQSSTNGGSTLLALAS